MSPLQAYCALLLHRTRLSVRRRRSSDSASFHLLRRAWKNECVPFGKLDVMLPGVWRSNYCCLTNHDSLCDTSGDPFRPLAGKAFLTVSVTVALRKELHKRAKDQDSPCSGRWHGKLSSLSATNRSITRCTKLLIILLCTPE